MANKKLKGIIWPNLPNDTYLLDSGEVNYDPEETYREGSTGKALQHKAEIDGYYSDMTVGDAEQLVSTVFTEDSTPYNFRTSGGSIDIGDREYVNGIVGGTVAWNQLAPIVTNTNKWTANTAFGTFTTSGNTLVYTITVKNGSQSITISNTAGGIPIVKGHKIFTSFYMTSTEASSAVRVSSMNNQWVSMPSISANTKTLLTRIYESDQDTGGNAFWGIYPNLASGLSVGTVVTVEEIQVFDLTQMFGSTIADYIYSLETATAGAGVAFFKRLFPKPYYEYNAGELMSVKALSHDMVGFNQWDEEWEVGGIDVITGEPYADNNIIRSKNFIRVIPSTKYFVGSDSVIHELFLYDANKNYKYNAINYASNNGLFTMPEWCCYVKFRCKQAYGTTYNHDICINIAWDNSRNGEYEPYELHSYPLDSDLTLRGIPKLDANNNLYYDGDIYEADGTVTRRFGVTSTLDTTNVQVGYSSQAQCNYADVFLGSAGSVTNGAVVTPKYLWMDASTVGIEGRIKNYSTALTIYDSRFTDTQTAISILNNENFVAVYRLATPTTEQADPYQTPQIVSDFGTEEFVIDTDIAVPVPVGHDTDYPVNLVAKLEMAPNSPNGSGDFIVRQTNGVNEYVPLVIEDALPTMPSTAGTYKLTVTVADGADPVLSWEAE